MPYNTKRRKLKHLMRSVTVLGRVLFCILRTQLLVSPTCMLDMFTSECQALAPSYF